MPPRVELSKQCRWMTGLPLHRRRLQATLGLHRRAADRINFSDVLKLTLFSASISSLLRIVERPAIRRLRARSISSFLLISSNRRSVRGAPCRVAAAWRADDSRALAFFASVVFCPEPPFRSPPPDCLLTVPQARLAASSLGTPLAS